ncbi:MAG: LptE family protein [Candidatus Omnitrophota bacterium]
MKNIRSLTFFPFFLLAAGIVMNSCGAHSPRTLAERHRSIHIPVFKNETLQYAIEENLTRAMIAAFQRDGRLKVVPHSAADLEMKTRIAAVALSPVAFSDLDRAVGYSMSITLYVSVVDAGSGEIVMPERPFQASGSFLLSNAPGAAQTQDISDILAAQALSYLIEGW